MAKMLQISEANVMKLLNGELSQEKLGILFPEQDAKIKYDCAATIVFAKQADAIHFEKNGCRGVRGIKRRGKSTLIYFSWKGVKGGTPALDRILTILENRYNTAIDCPDYEDIRKA